MCMDRVMEPSQVVMYQYDSYQLDNNLGAKPADWTQEMCRSTLSVSFTRNVVFAISLSVYSYLLTILHEMLLLYMHTLLNIFLYYLIRNLSLYLIWNVVAEYLVFNPSNTYFRVHKKTCRLCCFRDITTIWTCEANHLKNADDGIPGIRRTYSGRGCWTPYWT